MNKINIKDINFNDLFSDCLQILDFKFWLTSDFDHERIVLANLAQCGEIESFAKILLQTVKPIKFNIKEDFFVQFWWKEFKNIFNLRTNWREWNNLKNYKILLQDRKMFLSKSLIIGEGREIMARNIIGLPLQQEFIFYTWAASLRHFSINIGFVNVDVIFIPNFGIRINYASN